MDEQFAADTVVATETIDDPVVESTSSEYLGRWNRLVSTTNWEKGRIICEWREALVAAGAPAASYTDEAWSQRAGSVTPQHSGRLRRVYQQFGEIRDQYQRLFWSHFQVALDWRDAEMWLEGAVQNGWSISQMQQERSKTLGAVQEELSAGEPSADEMDEDAAAGDSRPPQTISSSLSEVRDSADDDSTQRDSGDDADYDEAPFDAADSFADADVATPARPFEGLATLPPDLNDAVEAFKLAIVNHRHAGWQEVSCEEVLAVLDALRQFALAPAML